MSGPYVARGEAVDLDNCEDEPIHIPGSVQPHGLLLAFDDDLVVRAASSNLEEWFGVPVASAAGTDLSEVLDEIAAHTIGDALDDARRGRVDELAFELDARNYSGALYHSTGWFVLELEPADRDSVSLSIVRTTTMQLNRATTVGDAAVATAVAVRQITGFDRVMVYRFDAQWNGRVIAEDKRDDLNTFLGLRYPSTDIPSQARELYRRNWLRLIPDIGYQPARIDPDDITPDGRPLDLSNSTIRSVSPIHVEYLANMGVTASMSVSIIVEGELWGLVACHHYSGAHRPSPSVRNTAEYIGQLASVRIQECERNERRQRTATLTELANSLGDILLANDRRTLTAILAEHEAEVLELADATGAAMRIGGEVVRFGRIPPPEATWKVLEAWSSDEDLFVCDHAAGVAPELATHADVAAGLLAISMSGDRNDLAVWFRPEQVELVDWAGDPYDKEVAHERPGVRLAPRKSFELWREVVRGRAEPWAEPEVTAALRFTRHVISSKLRRDRDMLSIADDLMKIMLPARLPDVSGFELDAFYASDGRGQVGGDWYDVVSLRGNTAFVVGDVAGHGLRAASTMTQARNSLRAYLADDPDPTRALERLNHLMRSTMPNEMLTIVVAVLDHESSTFCLCSAGHVPSLVAGASGAEFVDAPINPVLGVLDAPYRSIEVELEPGQMLLLYSDGLVERPQRAIDDGLAVLRHEARLAAPSPISGWAARFGGLMAGPSPHDDVTVLVVRATV